MSIHHSWNIATPDGAIFPGFDIPVLLNSIITAIMLSLGIGLVFGIIPASKTAVLNPTEALRYE
jgi:putative ABC transport system permease protein